jgi:hypothetical protein
MEIVMPHFHRWQFGLATTVAVVAVLVMALLGFLRPRELSAEQAVAIARSRAAVDLATGAPKDLVVTHVIYESSLANVRDSQGRLVYSQTDPFPFSLLVGNSAWLVEVSSAPPSGCTMYGGFLLVNARSGLVIQEREGCQRLVGQS